MDQQMDVRMNGQMDGSMASADVITEQYIYDELLTEILNFYIQIRGYAFTTKWMEDLKKRKVYKNQKVSEIKYKTQMWNCNKLIITIFPTKYIIFI